MRLGTAGKFAISVLAAVAAILALNNPTLDDYQRFWEREFHVQLKADAGYFVDLLASAFRADKFSSSLILDSTKRTNLGLFSIYETCLLSNEADWLGVAGRFFPIGQGKC